MREHFSCLHAVHIRRDVLCLFSGSVIIALFGLVASFWLSDT